MEPFDLIFTNESSSQLDELEANKGLSKKLKKVQKALGLLELNPRHPSLSSHKYHSMHGADGEDVWDSYVENNTPAAWRILWHYGPGSRDITVLTITPHP